jgi:nucleotide-binding universal stress UspA family protein
MKHILIPTDFSSNAWNAIQYALKLLQDEECTFYLLNTYTPAISSSRFMAASLEGGHLANSAHSASEMGLKNVLSAIARQYPNDKHTFKTISSFSLLVDEIVEIVADHGIDLVLVGTKGASGVEEVFMGSNTVRIIKAVKNCPVLAIPQNYEFIKPSEISFATDFNRFYTISELKPVIDLAVSFGAAVRIVHVQHKIKALTELQRFNLGMLRKYLGEVAHYVHTVSECNSVSETLELFAQELDIHLLAMLHYPHSYMERLTRAPVVKRVAFHTRIPLLVIPELGMGTSNKKNSKALSFSD